MLIILGRPPTASPSNSLGRFYACSGHLMYTSCTSEPWLISGKAQNAAPSLYNGKMLEGVCIIIQLIYQILRPWERAVLGRVVLVHELRERGNLVPVWRLQTLRQRIPIFVLVHYCSVQCACVHVVANHLNKNKKKKGINNRTQKIN